MTCVHHISLDECFQRQTWIGRHFMFIWNSIVISLLAIVIFFKFRPGCLFDCSMITDIVFVSIHKILVEKILHNYNEEYKKYQLPLLFGYSPAFLSVILWRKALNLLCSNQYFPLNTKGSCIIIKFYVSLLHAVMLVKDLFYCLPMVLLIGFWYVCLIALSAEYFIC